jgi:protein TonB
MDSQLERKRLRRRRAIVLSCVCHLAILIVVVALSIRSRNSIVPPYSRPTVALLSIAGGTHAIRVPLPEAPFAAHTRKPEPDAEAAAKTLLPVPKESAPKLAGGGAPRDPHKGDGSSTAMTGNGSDAKNVRPAFPVFSPHPPVSDRSLLPAVEQKIVVDVGVNELGQVVSETLVKGMGNRLDQIVLDIVKTWRFQPATIDGKPVPTEAELIFPFNSSYPITNS